MIVWTAKRGEGKSDALIHWALQDPGHRVVVVANEQGARQMRDRARDLLDSRRFQVIVAGTFASWQLGRDVEFAVDEVGDVLRGFLGGAPVVVTGPAEAIPVQRVGRQEIVVGQVWRKLDGKRVVRVERYSVDGDDDCVVRNLVNDRLSAIHGLNLRRSYQLLGA